ncbi:Uncharacterised protein [Burkholderia pseudomallei]|nr:Uncharacterised protein [Burkholderia pseudomallei]VBZ01220.1 Uncharacterised protein [Burkholderia pseudomallei]
MIDAPHAVVVLLIAVIERHAPSARMAHHPMPGRIFEMMRMRHRVDRRSQITLAIMLVAHERMCVSLRIDQRQRCQQPGVQPATSTTFDHAPGSPVAFPFDETHEPAIHVALEHPRIAVEIGHAIDRQRESRIVAIERRDGISPTGRQHESVFDALARAQHHPPIVAIQRMPMLPVIRARRPAVVRRHRVESGRMIRKMRDRAGPVFVAHQLEPDIGRRLPAEAHRARVAILTRVIAVPHERQAA